MALLGMQNVTIAFGGPPVLDDASFAIERGERVCLIGRNGAGKSTLMKLLDGTLVPDRGSIARQSGVTIARLEQEVPEDLEGTIFDVVAAARDAQGTGAPSIAARNVSTRAFIGFARRNTSPHALVPYVGSR